MHRLKNVSTLLLALVACNLRADVHLHALFSDNMVLQRGMAVPVWGWADEGEQVTVEYGGQVAKAWALGGKWMVRLKKLKTGEPGTLKVTGRNSISLANVVVGEVWLASGTSDMEWPMEASL